MHAIWNLEFGSADSDNDDQILRIPNLLSSTFPNVVAISGVFFGNSDHFNSVVDILRVELEF